MSPIQRFPAVRVAVLLIVLFLVAIPWWWRLFPATANATFLGAPIWFVTSVAGSLVVSIVTAGCLVWAWRMVDDEESPP